MDRIGIVQLRKMVQNAATKHGLDLMWDGQNLMVPPHCVKLGDRTITRYGSSTEVAHDLERWLDGYETDISVLKL